MTLTRVGVGTRKLSLTYVVLVVCRLWFMVGLRSVGARLVVATGRCRFVVRLTRLC